MHHSKHSPCGEFSTSSTFPLHSMLNVPLAHVADALVAPSATHLAVTLDYSAHAQIAGLPYHSNGIRRFGCDG